ncbi:hypothetical protein L9F63_019458, partial [Diploptera punctata]
VRWNGRKQFWSLRQSPMCLRKSSTICRKQMRAHSFPKQATPPRQVQPHQSERGVRVAQKSVCYASMFCRFPSFLPFLGNTFLDNPSDVSSVSSEFKANPRHLCVLFVNWITQILPPVSPRLRKDRGGHGHGTHMCRELKENGSHCHKWYIMPVRFGRRELEEDVEEKYHNIILASFKAVQMILGISSMAVHIVLIKYRLSHHVVIFCGTYFGFTIVSAGLLYEYLIGDRNPNNL